MKKDKLKLELKLMQEKEKLKMQENKVLLAETAILLLELKDAAITWGNKQ